MHTLKIRYILHPFSKPLQNVLDHKTGPCIDSVRLLHIISDIWHALKNIYAVKILDYHISDMYTVSDPLSNIEIHLKEA